MGSVQGGMRPGRGRGDQGGGVQVPRARGAPSCWSLAVRARSIAAYPARMSSASDKSSVTQGSWATAVLKAESRQCLRRKTGSQGSTKRLIVRGFPASGQGEMPFLGPLLQWEPGGPRGYGVVRSHSCRP